MALLRDQTKDYCQDSKETKELTFQLASSQMLPQLNLEMEMVSCAFSYQLEYMHMQGRGALSGMSK